MENGKNSIFFSSVCIIIVIAVVFLLFGAKDEKYYINRMVQFCRNYDVEISNIPLERVLVSIPENFDEVYQNYNEIQKKAGFDLEKYRGKNVWRYTFRVLNFDHEKNVFANILMYDNKIIGGDIMNPALDGFMYPLNFKKIGITVDQDSK